MSSLKESAKQIAEFLAENFTINSGFVKSEHELLKLAETQPSLWTEILDIQERLVGLSGAFPPPVVDTDSKGTAATASPGSVADLKRLIQEKDDIIMGLQSKVDSFEGHLDNLMKNFSFSSVRNITDNWHIFDAKIRDLKERVDAQKQNEMLLSFGRGGDFGYQGSGSNSRGAAETSNPNHKSGLNSQTLKLLKSMSDKVKFTKH